MPARDSLRQATASESYGTVGVEATLTGEIPAVGICYLVLMDKVLKNQGYHLLGFIVIGTLLYWAAMQFPDDQGRQWGLPSGSWMLISWVFAGVFQAWIAFFWRFELYLGKISAWIGDAGFLYFRIGFVLLGIARFLPLIPISQSTARTLPLPSILPIALIIVTTPPIIWTLYSVFFYFGVTRVFCADHFDPAYRSKSLEKRGIFNYIPNAMYTAGFLMFYHPGLLWRSRLGLTITAAHHAFVWCAYFCTEKPDMRMIYGERRS